MIQLDDTDQKYVANTLIDAITMYQMRMTDANVCESNRIISREQAKIANTALNIVLGLEVDKK